MAMVSAARGLAVAVGLGSVMWGQAWRLGARKAAMEVLAVMPRVVVVVVATGWDEEVTAAEATAAELTAEAAELTATVAALTATVAMEAVQPAEATMVVARVVNGVEPGAVVVMRVAEATTATRAGANAVVAVTGVRVTVAVKVAAARAMEVGAEMPLGGQPPRSASACCGCHTSC